LNSPEEFDIGPIDLELLPHATAVAWHESVKNIGEMAARWKLLGPSPNVINAGAPNKNDNPRSISIGSHPLGSMRVGQTMMLLGAVIGIMPDSSAGQDHEAPDPTHHWGLIVGDFYHELYMDKNFDICYENGKLEKEEWYTFKQGLGVTNFNDVAIMEAGRSLLCFSISDCC